MGELAKTLMWMEDKKTQKEQWEKEQAFKEMYTGPLDKAQTNLMAAQAAEYADTRIKDLQVQAENLGIAKAKIELAGATRRDSLIKQLATSDSDADKKLAINLDFEREKSGDWQQENALQRIIIENQRTQIELLRANMERDRNRLSATTELTKILLAIGQKLPPEILRKLGEEAGVTLPEPAEPKSGRLKSALDTADSAATQALIPGVPGKTTEAIINAINAYIGMNRTKAEQPSKQPSLQAPPEETPPQSAAPPTSPSGTATGLEA